MAAYEMEGQGQHPDAARGSLHCPQLERVCKFGSRLPQCMICAAKWVEDLPAEGDFECMQLVAISTQSL